MPPEPSEVKRSGVGSDLINGQTVNRKYSNDNYRISYNFDPTKGGRLTINYTPEWS